MRSGITRACSVNVTVAPPSTATPSCVTLPVAASGGAREKSFRTLRRRSTFTSSSPNGEPLGGRTSTLTTDRFAAGARHCPREQTFALEHWLLADQAE